ncbi:MAG: ribonuclease R, partial [Lachnospiraceae bacterium]|nr:ribonuclease R [Lachnospiraceae bacterium]
ADIFVPKEFSKNAESGMKVVVQITDYGDGKKKPEGVISEVIGREGDPGIDVTSAVKAFGIEEDFDEKVLNQAERVAKPVSDADREGRTDFRDLMMVTIDNDDSKDLDDAVSLYREENGTYVLGVHIADVSNYVQEKSALDRTARERGTSVYLPDRVIPMLPVTLSNGICSLNQNEDRLTLSCVMRIDKQGKLLDSYVTESIINSNRRMSYSEVDALLSGEADETLKKECEELTPMFTQMKELSDIIRNRRRESGAIDFDFPEAKIELNDKGEVERITNYVHGPSSRMIEDFMLSANEAVAETYFYQGVPFIYRSHEKPDYDDLKKLQSIAANLGFTMKVSKEGIHPFVLQELLSKVEGRPEKGIIQTLALRTMKRAKYTTTAIGHFGLSMKYYCHFTSPIRRYPDLSIHRIIKDVLRGRMNEKRTEHYEGFLNEVANHSSDRERNAEELERLVDDMKMAEYMEKHIGEVYEGIISGVTSWGIYVTIMDAVEGMVRLSDIEDDFYIYNEIMLEAVGKNTGKAYRLGMSVKVRVLSSDSHSREIDFMFEE